MATYRMRIQGPNLLPDSGVFFDRIGNQITAAATPSVGDLLAMVMADGGADEGYKDSFLIPKNYVGSPKCVLRAVLDGTPGAADILATGFRKRAVANNESADGTFDAEEIASATIGSNGSGHADEDEVELSITLTAGDYAVDDSVYFYVYLDASVMTYAGNVLVTGIFFEYTDT